MLRVRHDRLQDNPRTASISMGRVGPEPTPANPSLELRNDPLSRVVGRGTVASITARRGQSDPSVIGASRVPSDARASRLPIARA